MKKMYKAMLLVLCAILLVTGSVMGTLAYLKAQTGPVTNTFVTGKVKISLFEYEINQETGVKTDVKTATGITGIKLVPGREIQKNPVITVEGGSEKCYLFVKVENGLGDLVSINWAKNGESALWLPLDGVNNVYYYATTVTTATDLDVPVFNSFTCSTAIVNDQAYGANSIAITAYAIQADGFTTPAAAWTAGAFN